MCRFKGLQVCPSEHHPSFGSHALNVHLDFQKTAHQWKFTPHLDIKAHPWAHMSETRTSGRELLETLAGKDLNNDGVVINLVVCGHSKFYDAEVVEHEIEMWVKYNGYPDVIILGGASGVDFLVERWATNNRIPVAVFTEAWGEPRPDNEHDSGRREADHGLGAQMLEHATHLLAFPGPRSVWTRRMVELGRQAAIQVVAIEVA